MSLDDLLISTCDIQTRQNVKSTTMGANVNWIPRASGVSCRVRQMNASAIIAYGQLGYQVSHRVYMETDQSLTINDRIVIGSDAFEVRAVNNVDQMGELWQVDCERKPINF